jgi:dTDP-4-dehydrorhamnose 3,5-epimerase
VSSLAFTPTRIPEVVEIMPRVLDDSRGFFLESWNARSFAQGGIDTTFVQDNHSRSRGAVLRGLHDQIHHAQGKLVRGVRGEVFDGAVDLRRSSATFGQWVGVWLSEEKHNMLWVPRGFAHGFYVTSDMADLLYKCTDYYSPEHDRTLRWDDHDVAVEWPLVNGEPPMVSAKDAAGKSLAEAETFA